MLTVDAMKDVVDSKTLVEHSQLLEDLMRIKEEFATNDLTTSIHNAIRVDCTLETRSIRFTTCSQAILMTMIFKEHPALYKKRGTDRAGAVRRLEDTSKEEAMQIIVDTISLTQSMVEMKLSLTRKGNERPNFIPDTTPPYL